MPAFALVVNERNEVLLIQRGYGQEKGKWSLPGGMRDRGESLRSTAVRETLEETGIRMTADGLYFKGNRSPVEVWRGRRTGGRLKLQRKECLDAKWFQPDMLPHDDNLAFGPDKIVMGKWAAENAGARRVYYPRSKMDRAGFALVVNDRGEVLLIKRRSGLRAGSWSLPGGNAEPGERRRDAAVRETRNAAGMVFRPDRLYLENRHQATVWLGSPGSQQGKSFDGRWFPLDGLPDDDSLGFAVDVRAIEKWASENRGCRRVPCP